VLPLRQTVYDPASANGGSVLIAHEYISNHYLGKNQNRHMRYEELSGNEIVDGTPRMCAMSQANQETGLRLPTLTIRQEGTLRKLRSNSGNSSRNWKNHKKAWI
jgi:type I restriction-modification system DNA methylase subunit